MFVTWYKDGKQLYASYRYNTKTTPNSCILECLHECNTETTGRYSCEISNKCGSDICHAQVTVVTGQYQEMLLQILCFSSQHLNVKIHTPLNVVATLNSL